MGGMAAPSITPSREATRQASPRPEVSSEQRADHPWVTVVWNDPVNLMSYVTYVLQKLFGYDEERATKLMLDVHTKGKAVVSAGFRERMEYDVSQLHNYGLWATLRRNG